MYRVADALRKYAPAGVEFVRDYWAADVSVLHVIDHHDVPELLEKLKAADKRFAIMQYCMRSTSKPNTRDWLDIWAQADAVWSYYDLRRLCADDGVIASTALESKFYYAPLGCDADVFSLNRMAPLYQIATSGYVAESESVDAVSAAVRQFSFDARQFHLGPDLQLGRHVISKHGISDAELARFYNSCEFVSGLRRCEGFELPILEGFFCGARPITFNAPHYAEWFSAMAELIPEGTAEDVTAAVLDIFKRGRREVTREERAQFVEIFDWETLVPAFWERVL
jgi:glycosyltransferase involved in cell wall biosynthesis